MSSRDIASIDDADSMLKTMAAAFLPALDEVAVIRNEKGERRRALDMRELANVWAEIGELAARMGEIQSNSES